MKTVVAVHDLSCHAKSSLTVVIPTLAALGVEASVLPTALLSTQTDGFDSYVYVDLTETMERVLDHWESLALRFDSIYSGFLGSQRQIDTVSRLIDGQHRLANHPLVLVDPVLGDQGKPYGPVSGELIGRMEHLVAKADVITPNLTEAALLLHRPFEPGLKTDEAIGWAKDLSALGPRCVAITSVMDGAQGITVAYDAKTDKAIASRQSYVPVSYPGCGDLFAAILCALMVRGQDFLTAADRCATVVSKAVHLSWERKTEQRKGVAVELIMGDLAGMLL